MSALIGNLLAANFAGNNVSNTKAVNKTILNKTIGGVPESYRPFVIAEIWKLQQNSSAKRPLLVVVKDDSDVELLCQQLSVVAPQITCLELPAWDCLPYDRVSPSLDVITKRLGTLMQLLHASNHDLASYCVVTSVSALTQRLMPRMALLGESLQLRVNEEISRSDLLHKLSDKGFRRCDNVYEPGDFAVRGGIIDIFPSTSENPLRLDFFDNTLESIKAFDPATQRSINKNTTINLVDIRPVNEVILSKSSIELFKNSYKTLSLAHNGYTFADDPLFDAIANDRPYPGMEHWLPLFYDVCESILDYLPNALVIMESGNKA